jgi:hypothetical protein
MTSSGRSNKPHTSRRPRSVGSKSAVTAAQKKKIYRRRRIVAVIVLLLVIAFIWGLVMSIRSVVGAVNSYFNHDDIYAISKTSVPSSGSVGIGDCTADDVVLGLQPQAASVVAGQSIGFQVSIAHKGLNDCLIDASNVARFVTITSGDQTIWASNICPADSRQLLLSGDDKDTKTITWDTKQVGSECANGVVGNGTVAKPGTYHAQLSLRDVLVAGKEGETDKPMTTDQVTFTVEPAPAPPSTDAKADANADANADKP